MKQFQGAYYEVMIANCMIRAGFDLELEDEADCLAKHCEFSARSKTTGKRFWIEAKMRSVAGVLGKTSVDSTSRKDPTSQLSKHLGEALRKPAPDERMIFIDLNSDDSAQAGETPGWVEQAERRLKGCEQNLAEKAYIFVTNMAFHRALDVSHSSQHAVLAYGLGISDFGKSDQISLSGWYRRKQRHLDAHNVLGAFGGYPQIPETFEGQPVSEAFHKSQRLRIGESYSFEVAGGGSVTGTVASVLVDEGQKLALVAVIDSRSGQIGRFQSKLSSVEIADYRRYGNAYFGADGTGMGTAKDVRELFEWMVRSYDINSHEQLLNLARGRADIERLKTLTREDVLLELCEGWVQSIVVEPAPS